MTSWNWANITGRKTHVTRSVSAKATNNTGQGFFGLPSELRNVIYKYVPADAEDMRIRLESGPNKKHEVQVVGAETVPKNNEVVSPLNILLACKQMNNEATSIAYSKMSLSLLTVWPDIDSMLKENGLDIVHRTAQRLHSILKTLTTDFRETTLSHVTSMEFPDADILVTIPLSTFSALRDEDQPGEIWTRMCALLGKHKGRVHCPFQNIRRLTMFVSQRAEVGFRTLRQGASWLSPLMDDYELATLLRAFSNLEEVVVRRQCGIQTSDVIDGKIFVRGSGVPFGGFKDWMPGHV